MKENFKKCPICYEELYDKQFLRHGKQVHNLEKEDFLDKAGVKRGVCEICGKPTELYKSVYRRFCSNVCSRKGISKTKKEKYGEDYFSVEMKRRASNRTEEQKQKFRDSCRNAKLNRTPEQKEQEQRKREETFIKKYGYKVPIQIPDIKEKIKETCKEKYGVEHPMQNKEVFERAENTFIEKYGIRNPFMSEEIKKKSRETNLKKLGVEYPSQSQEVIKKRIENSIKKYGTEHPVQNSDVRKKINRTYFNTTYDSFERFKDEVIPLFTKEEFIGAGYKNIYNWKCVKCGTEFKHWVYSGKVPCCSKCHPINDSKPQREVYEFVKSIYEGEIIYNDYKTFDKHSKGGFELDIYVPDKKVAIEFNGDYWHRNKPKNYHYNKFKACEEKGIRLIQIWEHKWNDPIKRKVLENIIIGALGKTQQVYARNCSLHVCNPIELKEFFETNNIEGYRGGKVAYSLRGENGETLMAFIFGHPYHNKEYEWEMIRGAQKYGMRVVGGSSKLWSAFKKEHNPNNCIYYTMNDYYDGNSIVHLDKEKPWKFLRNQISFMNWFLEEGVMKARQPAKHQEIKELYEQGKVIPVWNAGNKVWVWNNDKELLI